MPCNATQVMVHCTSLHQPSDTNFEYILYAVVRSITKSPADHANIRRTCALQSV